MESDTNRSIRVISTLIIYRISPICVANDIDTRYCARAIRIRFLSRCFDFLRRINETRSQGRKDRFESRRPDGTRNAYLAIHASIHAYRSSLKL